MRLTVEIPDDTLADSIIESTDHDTEKLIAIVLNIDLRIADVGFTEELIKALVKSVRTDYATPEDFKQFITELSA